MPLASGEWLCAAKLPWAVSASLGSECFLSEGLSRGQNEVKREETEAAQLRGSAAAASVTALRVTCACTERSLSTRRRAGLPGARSQGE